MGRTSGAAPLRTERPVTPPEPTPPELLRDLFEHAVRAADPAACVPPYLPEAPTGCTFVAAAGKAAASMARAVEEHWPKGNMSELSGLAVTRDGHGLDCERIEVIEASHPVPDARSREAAARMLEAARALGPDDLLLALVSGGGSALMVQPAPGITLEEKRAVNRALLMSGAPIGDMNVVRRHLSAIKGGRLAAAAHPARIVTLAISDVPHDDVPTIASGPTVPDPSTREEALAVLDRYDLDVSDSVRAHLGSSASETPKPGDAAFARTETHLVATPRLMLDAAVAEARARGIAVIDMGADVEGEAREVGEAHARRALDLVDHVDHPTLLLSGGETTVTVTGEAGRGGRNAEYLLSLAATLDGHERIHALACDTDGIDGSEDNAGAIATPETLARAREKGVDAGDHLARHDAYSFFDALGDLIVTGPTRTNVNDLRAILVTP